MSLYPRFWHFLSLIWLWRKLGDSNDFNFAFKYCQVFKVEVKLLAVKLLALWQKYVIQLVAISSNKEEEDVLKEISKKSEYIYVFNSLKITSLKIMIGLIHVMMGRVPKI